MEEALFAILHNAPAIRAVVDDRIWPLERLQGSKLPAITYQRAGGLRDYDMEGPTGLVESRFLIMCWGEKSRNKSAYKQAKDVARLVEARISPAGGFCEIVGGQRIQSIFINNENDGLIGGATGTGLARVILDCTIWHKSI